MTDMDAAREWLTWLYGERPDGLLWIGGHGDGFRGRTFTSIDDAVSYAAELDGAGQGGVYHRLTTMRPVASGRGAAADSAYLPAFAMDLDLRGPGHKSDRYPETEMELVTLLRKAGLPEPSVWVHSGGGRYPFWKLDQPVDLTLPGELERAARVSSDLHRLVIDWAGEHGWKVDNTSDLARVYRLPGTLNRKGAEPVMCWYGDLRNGSYGVTRTVDLTGMAGAVSPAPRPAPVDPGPAQQRQPAERPAAASSLFGDGDAWASSDPAYAGSQLREFTVTEALAFVAPALEALRSARDGEINVRLNAAAVQMAHFGPEFWSREAAERQLYDALGQTDYDGRTWKATDTVASGWRAGEGDWRATLRQEPAAALEQATEMAEPDAVEALLAEMLDPEQLELLPPPRPLIDGVMSLDSEVWLIGPPGSKKSFVALDMARAVSTGQPWQGRATHQGLVVVIAAEGASGIGKRIKATKKRYGSFGRVKVLPRPVQAKDVAAWGVLVKACARLEPVMVIIDTQHRVTVGLEENSATDMGYYIAAVGAVRRATGAGIITLHHTGRRGGDARGSSALDGAQDTELTIVPGDDKLRATLKVTKQKDLEEGEPIDLRFAVETVGVDERGQDVTSLAVLPADAWRGQEAEPEAPEPWEYGHAAVIVQIFKILRDQGGHAGLTKSEARAAVVELHYGGDAKRLPKSTWYTGWDRAREKVSASGDQVMVNVGGQRWTIDPIALANLEPRDPDK